MSKQLQHWTAEDEAGFAQVQRARLLARVRTAVIAAAFLFPTFGLWEYATKGRYQWMHLRTSVLFVTLALALSLRAVAARPRLVLAAAVLVAAVSRNLMVDSMPKPELAFMCGNLMSAGIIALVATSFVEALMAGACQLAALVFYAACIGSWSFSIEATAMLVPMISLSAFMTRQSETQQRDTYFLGQALAKEVERFERLASVDQLTGLLNRRGFREAGQAALEHARRHHRSLTLVFIDVDHFKRINDTYGHAVGDRALALIAGTCAGSLRKSDLIGRIGGEELAVLLLETDHGAPGVAERIRRRVEEAVLEHDGGQLRFTISLGVALLSQESSLDELFASADLALYAAKKAGRNRVHSEPRIIEQGKVIPILTAS